MGEYRQIHKEFWNDNLIISLTPKERYFYLYLITNAHANQLGCYEISKELIYREIGYTKEETDELLDKFKKSHKRIEYDSSTGEILIYNVYKYNWSKSHKLLIHNIKLYEKIKSPKFKEYIKNLLIVYYKSIDISKINSANDIIIEIQQEKKEKKEEYKKEKEEDAINTLISLGITSEKAEILLSKCNNDPRMLKNEIKELSKTYQTLDKDFRTISGLEIYNSLEDRINSYNLCEDKF